MLNGTAEVLCVEFLADVTLHLLWTLSPNVFPFVGSSANEKETEKQQEKRRLEISGDEGEQPPCLSL